MLYSKIKKISNVRYIITSSPCPSCGSIIEIEIDEEGFSQLNQGKDINSVAPELHYSVAERFMSGICGDCWDKLWAEED